MPKHRGDTPEEDRALGLIEEGVINKVEPYSDGGGWSVTYKDSWGCVVRDVGVEPKVGDVLTTFGRFGYAFHGQALNGQVLWYLSRAEEEAERQQQLDAMDARRRAAFEEAKPKLDADYESLPPVFKKRIDRFRASNPDFRWESESYEMFVCTQAVALADWARQQVDDGEDGWVEEAVAKITEWDAGFRGAADYKAHVALVPGWDDGHSGNTQGCAVALAKEHLRSRERVAVLPGALTPLVGSADYSKPKRARR